MATMDITISNNNESSVCVEQTTFPEAINAALDDCARARHLILTTQNSLEDVPDYTSSPVDNYCNIRLHVNSAVESSIRGIGFGGSLVNRLRLMLSPEQKNEVSCDLVGLQGELVRTYASCQAADQLACEGLRQAIENDPIMRDDPIAVQCIDAIEEQSQHLQALPPTVESVEERRSRMGSIQENLDLLEQRTEEINPDGPLSKILKLFQKLFSSITHTLSSVIKTIGYQSGL